VDLGLERDLNVEVEVQPQPQGITLSASTPCLRLLDGLTANAAEDARGAVHEPAGRVPDAAELEAIEGARASSRLLLLAALPWWWCWFL